MTVFTAVYIQLTASLAGAKYQKKDLIIMNESLGELKTVIENAPEGASHYDGIYYRYLGDEAQSSPSKRFGWEFVSDGPVELELTRSLSDIKRIIELMERVKSGYEAYVRIESIKQKYNAENKQLKDLLKDITNNEDLDDCRFLLVDKILKGE